MCGMVFFSYDIKSFAVYEKDFIPKNKKKKVSPQRKGLKGSLVAGTHGVTSAAGAKRRR